MSETPERKKEYKKTHIRGKSFYFLVASLAFAAVMLVIYSMTGKSSFTPTLSVKVRVILGISIVLAVFLMFVEIKTVKYFLYFLLLWGWLEFLVYEVTYISNVIVGIDGNSFSVGFIATASAGLLAWVCALISANLQKAEIGSGSVSEEQAGEAVPGKPVKEK